MLFLVGLIVLLAVVLVPVVSTMRMKDANWHRMTNSADTMTDGVDATATGN